jgi:hypothetical protein
MTRPLPIHGTTQTQNKRAQTCMSRIGFEPTIPAFERAKAVHAVDRAATVISKMNTFSIVTYLLQKVHVKCDVVKRLLFLFGVKEVLSSDPGAEAGHHDRLIWVFFSYSEIKCLDKRPVLIEQLPLTLLSQHSSMS